MEAVQNEGILRGLIKILLKICTFLAGVFLVVMLVIIVIGVLSRYVFNFPFYFVEEYSGYLMVGIGFLGTAYAFHKRAHVRVDTVSEMLPKRARAGLETITMFIGICIIAILLWYSVKLFLMDFKGNVLSSTIMQTPLWIPQTFILIGWAVLLGMLILHLADKIKEWKG
jgi:TRAP-type C4-dicarboxylate transport system permease small subunit